MYKRLRVAFKLQNDSSAHYLTHLLAILHYFFFSPAYAHMGKLCLALRAEPARTTTNEKLQETDIQSKCSSNRLIGKMWLVTDDL